MEQLNFWNELAVNFPNLKEHESTDWKWSFKDYPEKNGIKVFSCYLSCVNYRCLSFEDKITEILKRSEKREEFYTRLIRLCAVCQSRELRLIIENPWSEQTYLKANFIKVPDLVDNNRLLRGDYYKKPTAYWFWNCEPTNGFSYQQDKEPKTIMDSRGG